MDYKNEILKVEKNNLSYIFVMHILKHCILQKHHIIKSI